MKPARCRIRGEFGGTGPGAGWSPGKRHRRKDKLHWAKGASAYLLAAIFASPFAPPTEKTRACWKNRKARKRLMKSGGCQVLPPPPRT